MDLFCLFISVCMVYRSVSVGVVYRLLALSASVESTGGAIISVGVVYRRRQWSTDLSLLASVYLPLKAWTWSTGLSLLSMTVVYRPAIISLGVVYRSAIKSLEVVYRSGPLSPTTWSTGLPLKAWNWSSALGHYHRRRGLPVCH